MWGHVVAVRDLAARVSYRAKLLLFALASRADRSGVCRPSIDQLAEDTRMSRRGVMRARDELVDAGLVLQIGGEYSGRSNRYRLAVDNSSDPCQAGTSGTGGRGGDPCQAGTPPVPGRHPTRANLAPEEEREEEREVSKSVCMAGRGASLARAVDNSSARDYPRLMRTAGWSPADGFDRKAAEDLCFSLGADRKAAEEFGRWNAIRRWSGVNSTSCVQDLALAWIAKWREENPAAADYEAERRRGGDRVVS